MQEGALNIKGVLEIIKPHLIDMRGNHTNKVYEILITYNVEEDEFIITTD
jgi:hypothetical protein